MANKINDVETGTDAQIKAKEGKKAQVKLKNQVRAQAEVLAETVEKAGAELEVEATAEAARKATEKASKKAVAAAKRKAAAAVKLEAKKQAEAEAARKAVEDAEKKAAAEAEAKAEAELEAKKQAEADAARKAVEDAEKKAAAEAEAKAEAEAARKSVEAAQKKVTDDAKVSADLKSRGSSNNSVALAIALQLERAVRRAQSEKSAEYLIVNDLRRLVRYETAVLWRSGDLRGGRLVAISGLEHLDPDNETFQFWFDKAKKCDVELTKCGVVDQEVIPSDQSETSLLWCPLRHGNDSVGGVLLARKEKWGSEEIELLTYVSESLAHSLWAWNRDLPFWRSLKERSRNIPKRQKIIFATIGLIVMLFPVRQSALAPAEIAPLKPIVMAAPMDGIVSKIHVDPNVFVKEGEALFSLDDTALKSRRSVAEKALDIAQADLQRVTAKAFGDDQSKGELSSLQARVEERRAELLYIDEQLQRTTVLATNAGVVIYGDPNEWIGKPVMTGERIMMVADPGHVEIRAFLSVNDAMRLKPGDPVSLFLNVSPVFSIEGKLTSASYEAYPSSQGGLAYIIKADIDRKKNLPRIGLQGTAKISGSRVLFIYYLLRRPFLALRRLVGF